MSDTKDKTLSQEEVAFCQEEIKRRLRKYDIVCDFRNKEILKKVVNTTRWYLGLNWDDIEEEFERDIENKQPSLDVLWHFLIIKWMNPTEYIRHLLGIPNSHAPYNGNRGDVPEQIKKIYEATSYNVDFIVNGLAPIYMKDVLRALSYHTYIKELNISDREIEKKRANLFSDNSYQNVPIDIGILQKGKRDDYYYVMPDIGGGILRGLYDGRTIGESGQNAFKDLFKKEKNAFTEKGIYEGKEEIANYTNLRKALESILSKSIREEDIWLLKNVFDPELITEVYDITQTRNMCEEDYSLIWTLCRCICPSVRLYLFEAIKPCYKYIKEYSRTMDDTMKFFLNDINSAIDLINYKFFAIVNFMAFYLDKYRFDNDALRCLYPKLENHFIDGDDFTLFANEDTNDLINMDIHENFLNSQKFREKCAQNHANRKKYMDFLPNGKVGNTDKAGKRLNKITFAIISGLQEQWTRNNKEKWDIKILEAESKELLQMQMDFRDKLITHIDKLNNYPTDKNF